MKVTDAGTMLVFSDATPEEKRRLIAATKEPKPEQPRMYTRKQVSEILRCHVGSVKRYDGKILNPIRITPRKLLYPAEQVDALLNQRGAE